MKEHPGKELGAWLKAKRQAKGFTARVFAGRIGLSPAEYAEVEVGIVSWVGERHRLFISTILELSENDEAHFNHLLDRAVEEGPLTFADVFTRDQLAPARLCNTKGEQLTAETREAILDAVFTPLTPLA